jgi:S1-C subfamily serine protease
MGWRSSLCLRIGLAGAIAAAVLVALGFIPRTAGAAVETGVVDVTTNLAYQNASAAGTGMVLTASGEVLTNNHVIRGATTIRVIDPATGHRYAATVVGYSVSNDVAVLQLKGASKLHTVALGDSSAVRIGLRVTGVGNANGVGGRPASAPGTVTGVGRSITVSDGPGLTERLGGLIRTNAALRPGDSGGPLVDAAGRVIAMITAGSTSSQYRSASQVFAIPINRARALAKQIAAHHASATVHVGSTPFIGVSVSPAPGQSAGALVAGVVSGSPADHGGVVAGDTITALDGQPIASYRDLGTLLIRHNAGTTVALQWIDQTGATQTATVQTADGPPQ